MVFDKIVEIYHHLFGTHFWDMILFLNSIFFAIGTASSRILVVRYTIIIANIVMLLTILFVLGIMAPGMLVVFIIGVTYLMLNVYKVFRYYRERDEHIIPVRYLALYKSKFSLFTPYEFCKILKYAKTITVKDEIIMKAGDHVACIWVLMSGVVDYKLSPTEHIEISEYTLLGEAGYISQQRLVTSTVTAKGTTELLVLNVPNLIRLSRKINNFEIKMRSLCALEISNKVAAVAYEIRRSYK